MAKRIRIELADADYHAIRYFSELQSKPMGHAIRKVLASYSDLVQKDFPSVRAHVLAMSAIPQEQSGDRSDDPDELPY
jgi:hypothetical protein